MRSDNWLLRHSMRHLAMKSLLALFALAITLSAGAKDRPYDESADAKVAISQDLVDAKSSHRPVLLIFGANWCEDCQALDAALKKGRNAELIAAQFKVVKVNVGNFDTNLDITGRYGDPIKNGIPAAVILSPDNEVLYATRAGELADARRMSDDGIEKFFKHALEQAQAEKK